MSMIRPDVWLRTRRWIELAKLRTSPDAKLVSPAVAADIDWLKVKSDQTQRIMIRNTDFFRTDPRRDKAGLSGGTCLQHNLRSIQKQSGDVLANLPYAHYVD